MFTLIIEDKHGGIADEYSFEEGEFYIGRSHTSDIILPSDNVSRRHARLYTGDGGSPRCGNDLGKGIDGGRKAMAITDQRRDVAKEDTGFREIRDGPDEFPQSFVKCALLVRR